MSLAKKPKPNPKDFRLNSFCYPDHPIRPSGPFHENVRLFLQECGEVNEYAVVGYRLWCTHLLYNKANHMAPLYTLEQDVYKSSHPYCKFCRSFGWSRHFVSKRTYHFIIPMDSEWLKPLDEGALDNQSHLLHGVIHLNGCGHLVCINGREGGSKVLEGREIMDLWDRICTNLKARQVSVEDVSRKRSMDLRLLHGVAYGYSWFGRWGYKFCLGNYNEAIEYLGSLEIDEIAKCHEKVNQMIRCYRRSETQMTTIRDLLSFMLTDNKFNTEVAKRKSRWPQWQLEDAAQVIVDAFLKSGSGTMTRQEVSDVAMPHIGDTDLLDHVLKLLNNLIFENYAVCKTKSVDNIAGTVGYTIYKHGNEPELMSSRMPGDDVNSDLLYVYNNVLLGHPDSKKTVQTILDSRHFVKDFGIMDEMERVFTFICKLEDDGIKYDLREPGCGVTVTVSLDANVGDLKKAAEDALRDTYFIAESVTVIDIAQLMGTSDEDLLLGRIQSGLELCVKVTDINLSTPFKYQGGADNRKVRCICGVEDDNGERMVACYVCDMWQHTRCIGIDDSQTLQQVFWCYVCYPPEC